MASWLIYYKIWSGSQMVQRPTNGPPPLHWLRVSICVEILYRARMIDIRCRKTLTPNLTRDSRPPIHYCFLTQSGHLVFKWAVFNFVVFHSKLVKLLFSSIYGFSEVLVVNHRSFQMQKIFSIFKKTTIIKTAHFKTGCPL